MVTKCNVVTYKKMSMQAGITLLGCQVSKSKVSVFRCQVSADYVSNGNLKSQWSCVQPAGSKTGKGPPGLRLTPETLLLCAP